MTKIATLKAVLFTTFVLLLFIKTSTGQTATTELKVNDKSFQIKIDKYNNFYRLSISSNDGIIKQPVTVTKLSNQQFSGYILSYFQENKIKINNQDELNQNVNLKYIELLTSLFVPDKEGQVIATIKLKEQANLYLGNTLTDTTLIIRNAQIVFEDGWIKSILVEATDLENETHYFSNFYPIGITTRSNIANLVNQKLYCERHGERDAFLNLSDVLIYKRKLGVQTNDYSPANDMIFLTPDMKDGIDLHKSPFAALFMANIFSDFIGINKNNPNGLIQVELCKRINIWTKRSQLRYTKSGIGFITHLTPAFQLSKIEENNRYMPLLQHRDSSGLTNFANPLQVLRYSTFNIRTDLNLIDIHGAAINAHLELLVSLSNTFAKDSILENNAPTLVEETINSFYLGPKLRLIFNPESAWSFSINGAGWFVNNLNGNIMYKTVINRELKNPSKWMFSSELLITLNTSNYNRVFGRIRYLWEHKNPFNNYSIFQIGYSMQISETKNR